MTTEKEDILGMKQNAKRGERRMKAKKGRKASRGEGRVCYKMLREEGRGRKKERK